MAYIFPEKIFPKALNDYTQCPFKFKCSQDKEIKADFIETPENFVGKVIHAVLKDFFDISKIPINKRVEQDLAEMVRHAWARTEKSGYGKDFFNKQERRDLFGSIEQEKAFGLKTISTLKNYLNKADLSVIPLFLEDWMDCRVGDFLIAGRIDRIDQDSEDSISVWDYKTSKLPYFNSIEKIIENDLQIPIYALIAAKTNTFAKKIRAGLIYIKYSQVYDIVWTRKDLVEIEKKVAETIKKAKQDKQLLPQINNLCPWCDYQNICPEKEKIEAKNKKVSEVDW